MKNYTIKIQGELRPVNTLPTLVIQEDTTRYTASGTSIPPGEAHARRIAREAFRWGAFVSERTRMRSTTIQQKSLEAACFSVAKRTSSLAIPSKLSGVRPHQRRLWVMLRQRVPAWAELTLDIRESEIVVLYEDERIGSMQGKHYGWVRPLASTGARLYLAKITGSEKAGYTLGVNVIVGHVGQALDRLLDVLGEAGLGSGGDGIASMRGVGGDGAAGGLRLVTPAGSTAAPTATPTPTPEAEPDDIVLYRDIDGTARATVNHVPRHSHAIEWGYHGSGPADLARSILLAFTDEATAERLHQAFKATVIAAVPTAGGVVRAADVRAFIAANEQ